MKKPNLEFASIFGLMMKCYRLSDKTNYLKQLEKLKDYIPDYLYDAFFNLSFNNHFLKKGK